MARSQRLREREALRRRMEEEQYLYRAGYIEPGGIFLILKYEATRILGAVILICIAYFACQSYNLFLLEYLCSAAIIYLSIQYQTDVGSLVSKESDPYAVKFTQSAINFFVCMITLGICHWIYGRNNFSLLLTAPDEVQHNILEVAFIIFWKSVLHLTFCRCFKTTSPWLTYELNRRNFIW